MGSGVAGKSFLIVGGTSGIGRAAAEVLAGEGANVALVGRNRERAETVAGDLRTKYNVRAMAIAGDASASQQETDRFVGEAVGALGDVAGMAVMTGTDTEHSRRPLDTMTDAHWAGAFEDLLMGTVRPCQAFIPYLLERGSGAIVTTAAYSVRAPDRLSIPYSTLKAAVAVYTKGLARTYGSRGIQVNCICPGVTETEVLRAWRAQFAEEKGLPYEEALERVMVEEWDLDVAMRRPGQPREVGEVVAFLLSQRAQYLTGALINIDGGTNF